MTSQWVRDLVGLPATAADWWRRTAAGSRLEHWLLLAGLPAGLVVVWLVPGSDGLGFSLAAESVVESPETFVSALTANYVHLSGRHLFDNLLNFWVTLFGIYPLVAIAGWKQEFRRSAAAYLVVAPFGIAWITLLTLGALTDKPSLGFSGITAAFLGFLPVVLAAAASEVTDGAVDPLWAAVPFCGSLAVVFAVPSVPYFPVYPMVSVGLLVGGLALGRLLWYRRLPSRIKACNRRVEPDVRLAFLIGATVFVFGVAGALLFVRSGTNVWGHLAGYLIGFTLPYLAFVVAPRLRSVPK